VREFGSSFYEEMCIGRSSGAAHGFAGELFANPQGKILPKVLPVSTFKGQIST
jgi:hypothetical protein